MDGGGRCCPQLGHLLADEDVGRPEEARGEEGGVAVENPTAVEAQVYVEPQEIWVQCGIGKLRCVLAGASASGSGVLTSHHERHEKVLAPGLGGEDERAVEDVGAGGESALRRAGAHDLPGEEFA